MGSSIQFLSRGVDESDALFNFGDIEIIVVKRENILTLNLRNLFNVSVCDIEEVRLED